MTITTPISALPAGQNIATTGKIDITGGIISDSVAATGSFALTDAYSGKIVKMVAGGASTVTIPQTLSEGFSCKFIQGDANQITFAGSGTVVLENASSHTKTRAIKSVVQIDFFNSTYAVLSGDTGA